MNRCLLPGLLAVLVCGCGPSAENRQVIQRLQSPNIAVRVKAISEAEAKPNNYYRTELLRIFDNPRELPLVKGRGGHGLGPHAR